MAVKTDSNSEIRALVESFTSNLNMLMRRSALEQIIATLTAGGNATMRPINSPRMITRTKKGGRRSGNQVAQISQQLLEFVCKNPGQRGEQIAKALRTNVSIMRLPMKKLIAEKKIKTKGQRRGMTYFAA